MKRTYIVTHKRSLRCMLSSLGLSQSLMHKSIRCKDVLVNGQRASIDQKLEENDTLQIWSALIDHKPARTYNYAFLEQYRLAVHDHFWVFNKPYGLAVQKGSQTPYAMDDLLACWMKEDGKKPYLVHRLDKHTTGLLIVATSPKAAYQLTSLFANRKIQKEYIAVCRNETGRRFSLYHTGTFTTDVQGKQATTHYKILGILDENKLLVQLNPVTGRKHQLRIHCYQYHMPIIGDHRYNIRPDHDKLHLHSYQLSSDVETDILKPFSYTASWPEHMTQYANFLLLE